MTQIAEPSRQPVHRSHQASRRRAPPVTASVVVPTCRRDGLLRRCLEKLIAQDFQPRAFEIIVVDDARSPTAAALIAQLSQQADIGLRLLPGAQAGPASARNIGWRAAAGEVIAFIDDDAYPADDGWLANGAAAFRDSAVLAASGRVVVPLDGRPTDFQRNVKRLEEGKFLTCNAFYRRSALEDVGGFDERFRLPFREDSDLRFRVESLPGRMVSLPEAIVIHPAPLGEFAISLRLQKYAMYNALAYKKQPQRYRRELQRRPPVRYYAIVGVATAVPVALLLGSPVVATACGAGWLALEADFFLRRLRGVSHSPKHVADMLLTSILIPPLAVYYRLKGAIKFRVLFI